MGLDLGCEEAYIGIMGQAGSSLHGTSSLHSTDHPDCSRPSGECCLDDGTTIRFRPIEPTDVSACRGMLSLCSPKSLYSRYARPVPTASQEMAEELCRQNLDCDLTIVAEIIVDGAATIVGAAQLLSDSGHKDAEYTVLVGDHWQGKGLGGAFTSFCLQVAHARGIGRVIAEFLPDNMRMIHILEVRDFNLYRDSQGYVVSGQKLIGTRGQAGSSPNGMRLLYLADHPDGSLPVGECCLDDGTTIRFRPIEPTDVSACGGMLSLCSPKSLYSRYERPITATPQELAEELCRQNPDCDLTIVAEVIVNGTSKIVGAAHLLSDPGHEAAEYAVLVGDPWQGKGLGGAFTSFCLQVAHARGIGRVIAEFLPDNMRMIHILEARDFSLHRDPQNRVVSGQKVIGDKRERGTAGSASEKS